MVVHRGVVGAPGVEDGVRASGPKVAGDLGVPASEPSTPVTSVGMISTFWFGELASCAQDPHVFSATK